MAEKKAQNSLKEQLNTVGYKLTPQRKAILEVLLLNGCNHLKCEDIYSLVRSKIPSIGIATIYRTLPLLEKMGYLNKVLFDDGFVRYEVNANDENHSHHHLICKNCGALSEIRIDMLDDLEKQIHQSTGFVVLNHSVKFYGLCAKCADNQSNALSNSN